MMTKAEAKDSPTKKVADKKKSAKKKNVDMLKDDMLKDIERDVLVRLTDDEKAEYKTAAMKLLDEKEELEWELKEISKEFKTKINTKDAELNKLRSAIKTGKELRSVVCEQRHDFKKATVDVFRKDNNDKVETRQLLPHERLYFLLNSDTYIDMEEIS